MTPAGNVRWVAAAQLIKLIVQVVAIVIYARLLPPDAIGVVAAAMVVINFAQMLRDFGLVSAVIQAGELPHKLLSLAVSGCLALGGLIGCIVFFAAPVCAAFLEEQRVVGVVRGLAWIFPLMSVGMISQALLERDGDFRRIARIEALSAVLGLIAGGTSAIANFGEFSPVVQALTVAVSSSVQLVLARPVFATVFGDWRDLLDIARFGTRVSLFNVVNYFARNADIIVLARSSSYFVVGAYSTAMRIVLVPIQLVTQVSARSIYPILCRASDDEARASLYGRVLEGVCFLTTPLMILMFVTRSELVALFLGPGWERVPYILGWLVPSAWLQSLVSTTGVVFMAYGRTDILLRLGISGSLLLVTGFIIGAKFGLLAFLAAYLIANCLNFLLVMFVTARCLSRSMGALLGGIRVVLLPAGLMMVASIVVRELCIRAIGDAPQDEFSAGLAAVVTSVCSAVVYLSVSLGTSRSQFENVRRVMLGTIPSK